MSNKHAAHFLFKYLIVISLITIILIGLCVIIGWHLHIPTLVQVIPGAIPMQYNTALCFITLAVSALAIMLPQIPRIFCIVTAGLVSLIGLMVVFQYASGISLGIDTLFFYPWEQTLSADPGRMALTTAFCFAVSGGSLGFLILNPRTLMAFVLAHTFPLSLGLTSLLGYVFGITYVLPFHLGSQMALHTASAFTVYGIAMLLYAWQYVPQTQDKLPKWAPGIAVIMIPFLFVSLSSSISNDSLSYKLGQLLLALVGAGIFALMLHKLINTRILYKGLILISIPLIFVWGFVLLVNQQKRENEKINTLLLHSKEVIAHTHTLAEKLVEAESNLRGYVISENKEYRTAFEEVSQQIPIEVKTLQSLVQDNPDQSVRAAELGDKASARIAILEDVKGMVDENKKEELLALTRRGVGKISMNEFHKQKDEFLDAEKRLDEIRRQEVETSWQRFDWLLASGASADLLLALTLAFLFTRGIGRRIQVLTENSQALAEGNDLAHPLTGTDEIAKLDLVFHEMADALRKSHAELETKVKERTKELLKVTEEVKKINETLEDRVIERTAELEASNKELEAFSYSVSHDLRAPLRAINGFANIFIEDYEAQLDDEGRRILDVIRTNAQNMGQLIDDLLEFSRLGRKHIEPTTVDMTHLAQDVCGQIESSLSKTPTIKIEELPKTEGDRSLLRHVFVNLVTNAVKYSRIKEDALVEIGGKTEANENIYYIRDNGAGFDMKYANKLFGVFQRLHSAEEFEGTGVGLAIVQRVIQRHGGRVWAEAEVNKGATFYFALPHNYLNHKEVENESE